MREPQSRPLTAKQAVALLKKKEKVRRSKFGVRLDAEGVELRTYKGVRFDSQFECDYAKELDTRVRAREIVSWEYHPVKIPLNAEGGKRVATYTPDFRVLYSDGTNELIETKGRKTPLFNRTMAHMKAQYPPSAYPELQIRIIYQDKKVKK